MSTSPSTSPPMTRRPLPLTVLAGARLGLALTALLMPRAGARLFRMEAEGTPATAMGRMFGIRNAALAAGLLRLDVITAPRGFVLINVVVDLVDALSLFAAGCRGEIASAATVLGNGAALTGAALGVAGLAALPDQRPTSRH
jgi:hypothetical protein